MARKAIHHTIKTKIMSKKNKIKTRQILKDRIKVTGTGRLFRRKVGRRHLKRKKNKGKKTQWIEIKGKQAKKIKKMLGI